MPGDRFQLARLPSLPTAVTDRPAQAFVSAPGKRTVNVPRALAVVLRVVVDLMTSTTRTCSRG
jgi:hypothetical protein